MHEVTWHRMDPDSGRLAPLAQRDGVSASRDVVVVPGSRHSHTEEPSQRDRIAAAALTHVERLGWQEALIEAARGMGLHDIDLHAEFADDGAAAWQVLLPARRACRTLLVDPPSVAMGLAMAQWFPDLTIRMPTLDAAALLVACARARGLAGVKVLCGASLPLPDRSFDVVVQPVSPTNGEALEQLLRLVCAGGCLYLAAPNPSRWLARLGWGRWLAHRSAQQLIRLGASPLRQWQVGPDHANPEELSPLQPIDSGGRVALGRAQTASSATIAGASAAHPAWVEDLIGRAGEQAGVSPAVLQPLSIRVSKGTVASLIVLAGKSLVVKVALDGDASGRLKRNFDGLRAGRRLAADGLSIRVPRPIAHDRFDGVPYTVETLEAGLPADDYSTDCDSAFRLLLDLQTAGGIHRDPDADWPGLVVRRLNHAIRWARTPAEECQVRELAELAASLAISSAAHDTPLAISHGDYKLANMLTSKGGSAPALIDWDLYRPRFPVTLDFCHLIFHRRVRLQRDCGSTLEALADWAAGRGQDSTETAWTEEFVQARGLSPSWRQIATLAYLTRELDARCESNFELNRRWITRKYLAIVPRVHRALL